MTFLLSFPFSPIFNSFSSCTSFTALLSPGSLFPFYLSATPSILFSSPTPPLPFTSPLYSNSFSSTFFPTPLLSFSLPFLWASPSYPGFLSLHIPCPFPFFQIIKPISKPALLSPEHLVHTTKPGSLPSLTKPAILSILHISTFTY